jgi:hypothetical protein
MGSINSALCTVRFEGWQFRLEIRDRSEEI